MRGLSIDFSIHCNTSTGTGALVKIIGLIVEFLHIILSTHGKALRAPLLIIFLVLIYATPQAVASDARFGVGAGIFDTLDDRDTLTGSLIFEGKPLLGIWDLRPTMQLLVIDDSGYYLGAGVLKEFFINMDWMFGFGFSAGVAHESEENKALEYDLEFYSRVFLTRQINVNNSLRLEFGHISNGGLDETNPGTEPLLLFWIRSF